MTRRDRRCPQTLRANRRRLELLVLLAPDGKCAECGGTEKLHIDHKLGKTWDSNKLSSTSRVAKYWREYKAGVPMQALCEVCNGRKNDRSHRQAPDGGHSVEPPPPPPPPHESHAGDESLDELLSASAGEEGFPPC